VRSLQYCRETFEATCQCGRCDPCTKGQDDIRGALFLPSKNWNVHKATRSDIGRMRPEMNEHSPSWSQIRLTSSFAGDGAAQ
jgi:hypothetical protein